MASRPLRINPLGLSQIEIEAVDRTLTRVGERAIRKDAEHLEVDPKEVIVAAWPIIEPAKTYIDGCGQAAAPCRRP